MSDRSVLEERLKALEGKGYPAYKSIKGVWQFPGFSLEILYVQGDPYATPSRVRVLLPADFVRLPEFVLKERSRRLGVASFLARAFAAEARGGSRAGGSGKSGHILMESPGQQVMPQTAVQIASHGGVEARLQVGLPARGRRIMGKAAAQLLCTTLPELVETTLRAAAHPEDTLLLHAQVNEDGHALRSTLPERGLVAFVADGALLPRRSGVEDTPMEESHVVLFRSPDSLRVTIPVPHAGEVTGMGIPLGITLIVGGGYHGKSTLLRALECGVYNHRPDDGREQVVTLPDAMKVRAEDGRSVAGVDISSFIAPLPDGTDTRTFSTANASGSTSQAAAIVEALEAGASTLLMDEDTCATNFLIRDRRMQALVPREREPITPFLDRVEELRDDGGISSILVLGGSGDYLDVADTVIAMNRYLPEEITARAREVASAHPTGRLREVPAPMAEPGIRIPDPDSVDPSRGRRAASVKVRDTETILFGQVELELHALEQLLSRAQARGVSEALLLLRTQMDGHTPLPQLLDGVMGQLEERGLDILGRGTDGDLAGFRRLELAGALNRLRGLRVH
ncbi:MAG: ABC-ATPase domain-containing protein [Gemmatimonadota bacterium]